LIRGGGGVKDKGERKASDELKVDDRKYYNFHFRACY